MSEPVIEVDESLVTVSCFESIHDYALPGNKVEGTFGVKKKKK